MNNFAKLAVCAVAMTVAGCASPKVGAVSPLTGAYLSHFAPPPGEGRVYILPTRSKGLFNDSNGRADLAIFPADSDHGAPLGATGSDRFVAFDVGPGSYDLVAHGGDAFSRITAPLDVEAGTVYFLRPIFFRSTEGTDKGAAPGMTFDPVPPAEAEAELSHMSMAETPAKGEAFLRKTLAVAAVSVPAAVPAAAPAGVARPLAAPVAAAPATQQAAPAPLPPAAAAPAPSAVPAAGVSLEEKLRVLQRLFHEGLISKADLDAKRKALLEAF